MRKWICLALSALLALGMFGCGSAESYSARFYYPRNPDSYEYGTAEDVIAPENRYFPSPADDPEYLLRLYLDGPVSEGLINPFPEGLQLLGFHLSDQTLTVVLSTEFSRLEDIRMTIACACLTNTCFQITDVENLVVLSGSLVNTYTRESFLYLDDSSGPEQ